MLLDELIRLGARRANPGEFTARAYFNGRLDLSQAEGVASIIAANSETELRAARQLLAGELARRVKPAMDLLTETLGLVEVGIDFSEEDVEFLSSEQIQSRLSEIDTLLSDLLRDSARIERLHHTPQFVLIGRPNAGKSTLLNALAGEERAVVSPQAGTTRDALSADVALARGVIRLIDVAGIEERSSANEIEQQMHRRALSIVETADRVLLVYDVTDIAAYLKFPRAADLVIRTKADLLTPSPGTPSFAEIARWKGGGEGSRLQEPRRTRSSFAPNPHPNPLPAYREREPDICVSAHTGENMPELRQHLDQLAFGVSTTNTLAINARHTQAIQDAREAIAACHCEQQVSTDGPRITRLRSPRCARRTWRDSRSGHPRRRAWPHLLDLLHRQVRSRQHWPLALRLRGRSLNTLINEQRTQQGDLLDGRRLQDDRQKGHPQRHLPLVLLRRQDRRAGIERLGKEHAPAHPGRRRQESRRGNQQIAWLHDRFSPAGTAVGRIADRAWLSSSRECRRPSIC